MVLSEVWKRGKADRLLGMKWAFVAGYSIYMNKTQMI